jgi:hypothetical protein
MLPTFLVCGCLKHCEAKCGREGPNVGFPALTHDRVAGSELGTEYLLPPAQSASSYASAFVFLAGPRVCFIFGILATSTPAPADLSGQWQPSQVSFEGTRVDLAAPDKALAEISVFPTSFASFLC